MTRTITLILLSMIWQVGVLAQESAPQVLEYGNETRTLLPVTGRETEIQFTGSAGDIIIIEAHVRIDDILTAFHPVIAILNERGSTLAKSTEESFQYIAILPIELPLDGEYTVIVEAGTYSYLESDAPFHLRLLKPEQLVSGVPASAKLVGESPTYYTVVSGQPFSVVVNRADSGFFPTVAVATIESGDFEVLGLAHGQYLKAASLTVQPRRNTLHFVELAKPTYEDTIIPIDEEVDYSIELTVWDD